MVRNAAASSSSASSETTCAVCLCDLPGDPSRWETPTCKHKFCTKCILTWVNESSNSCPLCRQEVLGDQRRRTDRRAGSSGAGSSRGAEQANAEILDGLPINEIVFASVAAFVTMMIIRVLFSQVMLWLLLLLAPVYVFAHATLPPDNAFDAKREIKRVVRGEHLQEGHPERPQSWLAKLGRRVAASIGVEIASVGGYTQEITTYYGVAKLLVVSMDLTGQRFYWIGAFGKFHFVGNSANSEDSQ